MNESPQHPEPDDQKPPECPPVSANGRKKREIDELLIAALAAGKTIADAATAASVSIRTVSRRMQDSSFRQRVSQSQSDLVQKSLGIVADSMAAAATKLRDLLKAASESIQLGAARTLLEFGVRLRDTVEFEQRLIALEAKAEGGDDHSH